ncbi:ATP-binding cassette domain-containing protein [Peptoniphilus obesi]|uniref:ATP-binding cassette domain-containing protein n=1 Tax=Peptoniphilus obesi TaxID=1472765 RepID=UPI0004B94202|nr:ABC transporter ATP-binding protein [Peptoniphilus obesi]
MKMYKKIIFIIRYVYLSIGLMYKASKIRFLIILVSSIFLGILNSTIVIAYKYLIDGISFYIKHFTIDTYIFVRAVCVYSMVKLLIRVITQINDYYSFQYFNELDKFFTINISKKISRLKMESFDNSKTYNLIQMVYKDSTSKNKMMLDIVMDMIRNLITMVSVSYIIIKFSMLCFFVCIVSSILNIINEFDALEKLYNEYNKQIESIRYIEILKSILTKYNWIVETKVYSSVKILIGKMTIIYDNNLKNNKSIKSKYFKRSICISVLEEITNTVNIILIILRCSKLKISIGSAIMYFQTMELVRQSLTNLFSSVESSYESCLYIEKYFDLMNLKESNEGTVNLNRKVEQITFENVSFRYPNSNKFALKNFNYTFKIGKNYGIIGLNGSGKTTLTKLILGMYDPTEGEIKVDGVLINNVNKNNYYKYFDTVHQDFIKYPFSLRENISIGSSHSGEYELISDNGIYEILSQINIYNNEKDKLNFDYDNVLDKSVAGGIELSGGEWQKVAIARALYNRSEILLLDEPTSSIDSLTEENIFNLINKNNGEIMNIIISHRLRNLVKVDEIILLDHGVMVASGSHQTLLKNELYKKLYNSQDYNILNDIKN